MNLSATTGPVDPNVRIYGRSTADDKGPIVAFLAAIDGLMACALADDPFLRKQTAHALSFWTGTDEENKRSEVTLLVLARDDGHGTAIEIPKEN